MIARGACAVRAETALVGLFVLGCGPEFGNLLLNSLLNASLEFRAVSQHEQDLKPNEQWGEEDGLDQVVQQSRCAALKRPVSNELSNPSNEMGAKGHLESGGWILRPEIVGVRRARQAERRQRETSNWLKKQIKRRVHESRNGAQVEVQIWDREPAGSLNKSPSVRGLREQGR